VRYARDIQVRHPDGRIWHVRRRWARRRLPWRRPDRQAALQHHQHHQHGPRPFATDATPVLTDAELLTWPSTTAEVLRDLSSLVELPAVVLALPDLSNPVLLAIGLLSVLGVGLLLVWVHDTMLGGFSWILHHPSLVMAAAAIVLALLALLLVRRPWLVVAERQGLADAPRRAWRVIGWRRSGRFARQVAEAIRDGRCDASAVVVVSPPHEPRSRPEPS
jgi:hypothetical protein